MKNLCRIFMLFTVFLTNPAWTVNPQPQADPTESRSGIPFKLYAGYLLVVEGRIGGFGKLRFVLDTGVTHSVIDRKVAARTSVERRSGKVLNFDRTVLVEWTDVSELQFGPIDLAHFSMIVSDLRYFQSFATSIDAVIGLDVLRLNSFSIDYDARKIFFGPMNTASGIPMISDPVCLSVQLVVGDGRLRVVVDTGAPALVLYEDRILDRTGPLRVASEIDGSSMGAMYTQNVRPFRERAWAQRT